MKGGDSQSPTWRRAASSKVRCHKLSNMQGGRSMQKIAVQLGFALAILASATTSHARIFVKIQDNVNGLIDGSNPATSQTVGAFNVWKDSRATDNAGNPVGYYVLAQDVTDVMPLFTCSPCTVYFPSGLTPSTSPPGPLATDTFAFSDTNAT